MIEESNKLVNKLHNICKFVRKIQTNLNRSHHLTTTHKNINQSIRNKSQFNLILSLKKQQVKFNKYHRQFHRIQI